MDTPERQGSPVRMERMRELDLLRFAAALAVLLFHFTGFGGGGAWPDPSRDIFPLLGEVTRYGYLGVDLFFVISGFVILMSVWGRTAGEFGVSRIVRLMPAYWAAVLLGLVIYLATGLGKGKPGLVLPNLTMLQGGLGTGNVDAVFWTLWVELHFYVLIALLAAVGLTYRRCIMFMTAWLFLGLYADEGESKLLQVLVIPTWNAYFVAGMALFLIYRFGSTLLLWGFVGVSWLMALHWGAWRAGNVFTGVTDGAVAAVITGIFAIMALVAIRKLSWLSWRGLTVLGALTYPLYLTHSQIALPVLDWIYPGMNRWAALAVVMAASLLLAYVIHRLVERPAAAWLRDRLRAALARAREIDFPKPVPAPRPAAEPVEPSGELVGGPGPRVPS
ncbi:acyltransferase family protein [Actinomadura alba]|uniref:Acyltransferase n=1 Tax=Actinomadura alba TaxID=406431 RepID=A0ABR7M218_9ACTN|nr:acyltransferase [Actinomadura alba]MBC6470770.1 acyltransferase [Actinomadura alba]